MSYNLYDGSDQRDLVSRYSKLVKINPIASNYISLAHAHYDRAGYIAKKNLCMIYNNIGPKNKKNDDCKIALSIMQNYQSANVTEILIKEEFHWSRYNTVSRSYLEKIMSWIKSLIFDQHKPSYLDRLEGLPDSLLEKNTSYLVHLAHMTNNMTKRQEYLEKAAPSHLPASYDLGLLYKQSGNHPKAIQTFYKGHKNNYALSSSALFLYTKKLIHLPSITEGKDIVLPIDSLLFLFQCLDEDYNKANEELANDIIAKWNNPSQPSKLDTNQFALSSLKKMIEISVVFQSRSNQDRQLIDKEYYTSLSGQSLAILGFKALEGKVIDKDTEQYLITISKQKHEISITIKRGSTTIDEAADLSKLGKQSLIKKEYYFTRFAIELFDMAKSKGYKPADLLLGKTLINSFKPEDKEVAVKNLLSMSEGNNTDAIYLLGKYYFQQGDYSKASTYLLKVSDFNYYAKYLLCEIPNTKIKDKISCFEKIKLVNNKIKELVSYKLALLHVKNNDNEKAISFFPEHSGYSDEHKYVEAILHMKQLQCGTFSNLVNSKDNIYFQHIRAVAYIKGYCFKQELGKGFEIFKDIATNPSFNDLLAESRECITRAIKEEKLQEQCYFLDINSIDQYDNEYTKIVPLDIFEEKSFQNMEPLGFTDEHLLSIVDYITQNISKEDL